MTLRVRAGTPSLRYARLVRAFEQSLRQASERHDFRVVHYSLQSNHLHLLVEAAGAPALARGMKSVGARLARAVNRVFVRTGPVLADRYHLHVLKTPREVWNALRYVLLNGRHHAARPTTGAVLDPASSARWFDGWTPTRWARHESDAGQAHAHRRARPVARARSWLLATGWQRYGPIDPHDVPARA